MQPWHSTAVSLLLISSISVLTACGGGGSDSDNEGEVISTPPASSGSSSSGGSSGGEGSVLHEDFGDGLLVNFDEADTQFFFSQEYKALNTSNPEDARPSFYYPTCCFFANDNPADGPEVALDQMGIVSDNGNPALQLDTGRFTIGQTRPDSTDPDDNDPKKDTTTSDDVTTWGELDLSSDYRISFCVKAATGTRNMQVYVDNNTSGEANSIWGGGSQGSRIFNVPAGDLIPAKRVQINVPGDITFEPGGEAKDIRPQRVGTASSFLQFRVEGGSTVIFDDLLVEPQSENGQAALPECTEYQPATAPEAPEAPGLFAGDGQISASWSGVVGATGYELAYNTTDSVDGAPVIAAENIEGTQHNIEGLENDTEYFVFLRVINSVGPGEWSESASGTPTAPEGDDCAPTQQVDPSPENGILWNVYDGCTHPGESGAVIISGSSVANFDFSDEEKPWFSVSEQGVMTLDTRNGDENTKPVGDLGDIIAGDSSTYPKYFTFIARIDTSLATTLDGVRGFEVETHLGDSGVDTRGPARIKTILRPDGAKLQLDKFLPDDSTAEIDMDMADGFHTYQVSFVVNDPATAGGDEYITATVYRDGVEVGRFTGNGRDGGSSSSKMRIGEGSGSPFHADVDWLIWSDSTTAAGLTAEELVGELPEGIGELGSYAGADASVVFEEDFDGAGLTEGDAGDSNFFTTEYRAQSGDASKPMYNVTSSGSRILIGNTADDGNLSFNNARFSIGDALAGTDTADTDTSTRGDLDLSKPYTITFDVLVNENVVAGDDTGKCQVYVDNNTASSSQSLHGGDSKIFEKLAPEIADGDQATGVVTIVSKPGEDHVGTAASFLQLRCDSRTEAPITIDNFKVVYQ